MEVEYFIHESDWEQVFADWLKSLHMWCEVIGLKKDRLHEYEHPKEKLSHYSKRTVDIMYDYPFGRSELYGLAYRTNFDLRQHAEHSGKKLEFRDPHTNEVFIPHVVEPALGVERSILAVLCDAYTEEELEGGDSRVVMKFAKQIAPVKVAILPLMKKDGLPEIAEDIYQNLSSVMTTEYDDGGSVGKRYRRQDEIGTPFCVTIDYESKDDHSVTVRERDSMRQERIKIEDLKSYLLEQIEA